jgi:glycosyltransferase involved in cell wall biosynthesis
VAEPSILLVHNQYQQPGGEDEVVRAELAMLRSRGHELCEYRVHNRQVDEMSRPALLAATIWNRTSYKDIQEALRSSGSKVAHFHNTFPLVSPAGYYAARRRRVPVVQTLHNYRLLCPSAVLFRHGRVCEACVKKPVPWPGVVHACYRGSRSATAAVAGMLSIHRAMGTWNRMVHVYIALTDFARRKFIEGGLPADAIVVKPNFTEDPGLGAHQGDSVLFVGRLVPEKGIEPMLQAWRLVSRRHPGVCLKIIGDGPLRRLQRGSREGVEWRGWQSREQVRSAMLDAAMLLFPSAYYEGFPMAIAEAFAAGLPVVAGRLGAGAELIREGYNGRLYRPDDPLDLADALDRMLSDRASLREMGLQARREYEAKYTPDRNYEQLMRVYALAIERAKFA